MSWTEAFPGETEAYKCHEVTSSHLLIRFENQVGVNNVNEITHAHRGALGVS
jgi:hypothetical protein